MSLSYDESAPVPSYFNTRFAPGSKTQSHPPFPETKHVDHGDNRGMDYNMFRQIHPSGPTPSQQFRRTMEMQLYRENH